MKNADVDNVMEIVGELLQFSRWIVWINYSTESVNFCAFFQFYRLTCHGLHPMEKKVVLFKWEWHHFRKYVEIVNIFMLFCNDCNENEQNDNKNLLQNASLDIGYSVCTLMTCLSKCYRLQFDGGNSSAISAKMKLKCENHSTVKSSFVHYSNWIWWNNFPTKRFKWIRFRVPNTKLPCLINTKKAAFCRKRNGLFILHGDRSLDTAAWGDRGMNIHQVTVQFANTQTCN